MWTYVYVVLAAEWSRLSTIGDESSVALVQGELDDLFSALEVFAKVFPFKRSTCHSLCPFRDLGDVFNH